VVQGPQAPDSVVAALGYLNQLSKPLDVIVLIRGGGSLEDLAAFSTEPVTRAVASSRTPIIVGVGHEVDTSLADLAADVRAATPTDAARLAVPDRREVLSNLDYLTKTADLRFGQKLAGVQNRLDRAGVSLVRFVERPLEIIARTEHQMWQSYAQALVLAKQRVTSLTRLLTGLDPAATLKRGYAIVRRSSEVLRDASVVKTGDKLMIQLAKGNIGASVDESS
jgi:exodeoxyribonuclease VII large subunit